MSTSVSSESTADGASASISERMRSRTDSDECASPPDAEPSADVKKYRSSNVPRGVIMYLFTVTRLIVDSCIPIASATVRRLSGRR